jgi:tetratricopeptide (TPR) repeat protein
MSPRKLVAASLLLVAGCASGPPAKLPPADPIQALQLSGKKVDFAIGETKRLIQRSRGADYLPDLYMRLAELYSERARYAWLVVYERHHQKGDDSKAVDAPEARLLKNLAIGVYDRVMKEFPKYPRDDEAMFLMAHEHRELGEFDEMRSTYEKLIETYPHSKHRFESYLVLGDAAFDKGDLPRAERYYNLILAAPESHVHPLARYKLGWVKVNKDDCKGAVAMFEKILRDKSTPHETKSLVMTQRSLNISREALVDLAYCYPDVYPEKPAPPYLRSLAVSSSDYIAAMRRVANRFFIKQMYAPAVGALRVVLSAGVNDDEAIETARKLYDNIIKGKVLDRPAADVDVIGRVYEHRAFDLRMNKDKRDKLAEEFEIYARDIATRAQVAAKESKTPALYANAAAAYTTYLQYFSKSASKNEITENRAEALLAAGQLYQAGKAFEEVDAIATSPDAKKQARLNSIAAYQQAIEKGGLSRIERLYARGGIRNMGRLVIADSPQDPNIVGIKLNIARSYYEDGEYQRSAELFYALARQYPTAPEATVSGHLALDALRLADNLEGLATVGRRMVADAKLGDANFKREISDIVTKAEQRQVTELTITGESDREEQLLSMAKRHKGSELGEQALFNALAVARTNGDIDRFYELGEAFLEQYPKSNKRSDVTSALATVASDRGDYAQAATYLTAAFNADPNGKEATERLQNAAQIRALLGDATVAGDVKKLVSRGSHVDDLMMVIAESGNLPALEDILSSSPVDGAVADFFRGYFALQRGDREDAVKKLTEAAHDRGGGEAGKDASARALFLLGEIAFDAFNAVVPGADIGKAVQDKNREIETLTQAYNGAVRSGDARWALAGIARMSEAWSKDADFLRDLNLDALSATDKQAVRQVLDQQMQKAQEESKKLRSSCAKKAKELLVFTDAAKACVTDQPFQEKVGMFTNRNSGRKGDPPGAAPIRQALLKNPRSIDSITKLAELYLGTGDTGVALLLIEHAIDIDAKKSASHNLRGIALYRAGRSDEAYAAFVRAVELDPSNARARLNLAAHLALYGYNDRAMAEVKRAGGVPMPHGDPSEHPELRVLSTLSGGK